MCGIGAWLQNKTVYSAVTDTLFPQKNHFSWHTLLINWQLFVWVIKFYRDWACENRTCGHKLHPVKSSLSTATEYLWSVTFTIKPIKCLIMEINFMAIRWSAKSDTWKFDKVVKFCVSTCLVFAGSVTLLWLFNWQI